MNELSLSKPEDDLLSKCEERIATHERQLLPVPTSLSLTEAAAVPEVFLTAWDALVLQVSEALGFVRRAIGTEEILERCLLALVNEGAKILQEGIAQSSHDIDLVYLNGYGFPAERGGPMSWADTQGAADLLARLQQLQTQFGSHLQPAQLIEQLAASGQTFSSVKGGRP